MAAWIHSTDRNGDSRHAARRRGIGCEAIGCSVHSSRSSLLQFSDLGGPRRPWVRALKDPQVGMAITNIHRRPENHWTVATPHSQRNSRSWSETRVEICSQMARAQSRMVSPDIGRKLSEIARRVGYESEIASSRAFQTFMGTSPGAYRKTRP